MNEDDIPGVLFKYLQEIKQGAVYPLDAQDFEYYVLGLTGEAGEVADVLATRALKPSLKADFDLVLEMGDWLFYAIVGWYKCRQLTWDPDSKLTDKEVLTAGLDEHYNYFTLTERSSVNTLFLKIVADSGRVSDTVKKSRRTVNPRPLDMRECGRVICRALVGFEYLCHLLGISVHDVCQVSVDKFELKRLRSQTDKNKKKRK